MEAHNINKVPAGYRYDWSKKPVNLNKWNLEYVERNGAEECWYYYLSGDYEGSGLMLARKGNQYALHSLSHCSCYGPTERFNPHWRELAELKTACSEKVQNEAAELFAAAELAMQ